MKQGSYSQKKSEVGGWVGEGGEEVKGYPKENQDKLGKIRHNKGFFFHGLQKFLFSRISQIIF